MVENGERKGGRQGINGLRIVTKTINMRNVSQFFGESSAEIGGWMGGVRNVFKKGE